MKYAIKGFLLCCILMILTACSDNDGKNDLQQMNVKEISSPIEIMGLMYGVIDNNIIYGESNEHNSKKDHDETWSIYRYDWESKEKSKIGELENTSRISLTGVLCDNKLYFWTRNGNRQREENVVDQLMEIDLEQNTLSVVYETLEEEWIFPAPDQGMQSLENELLIVLKRNGGFEVISYDAETKTIEVRLQYQYDDTCEEGEYIRAIDTNKENVCVLIESRHEDTEVQYRIDVYDHEFQLLNEIDITNIHGTYDWEKTTDQFEYADGYLLHSNEEGNDFFGKVSKKKIQTILEYSPGYWDHEAYFANEVYFDVRELAECDSYKYARRMETSEIYRVDLKNGKVSCAEIIGAPEEYQMTYVLRINEEQMLMEFTKNLDEIGNAESKWYLVEIDELKFKKVSKK